LRAGQISCRWNTSVHKTFKTARSGLTRQERQAYSVALLRALVREKRAREREKRAREREKRARERENRARERVVQGRLEMALAHAGAELIDVVEHADRYSVSWHVDGERHISAVDKSDDLEVMVAGICLAGQDRRFDLSSLVGVVRGAYAPRVGDEGMSEQEYFDIYGMQGE
jgi:hypothetical protein